jgi:uncharacterized protein (DUF58 family)
MPTVTTLGLTALFGLAALTLGAGLTANAVLGLAAAIAGALLLLAYASLALLLFELKRRRLEFTWSLRDKPEPRAGGHAELELRFRNLSPFAWRALRVEFIGSSALSADPVELDLVPRSSARAVLPVRTPRAGRWIGYGATLLFEDAAGLFRVAPYCPRHLVIRVRPSSASGASLSRAPIASEGGARARRQRGLGTDLREIREHRHGDPFRRIAWKASARRGRLMVREFEAELRVPVMLALDVGPSMRLGAPGHAAIDQGVRAALGFAESALADGDPVGLSLFSSRLLSVVPTELGIGHLRKIEEALLGAMVDIPPEDALDGRLGLLRAATGYLIREAGLRVRPDLTGAGDDLLVTAALHRILEKLWKTDRIPSLPDDEDERLRLFARHFGLDLPPAGPGAWLPRERGIAAALDFAASEARGAKLLLVISDLEAVHDVTALARAFARRRSRVRAAVVMPAAEPWTSRPGRRSRAEERLAADLRLRAISHGRERRALAALLTRAGVPVLAAAPGDDLRGLLAKAATYRELIRAAG